jgi:hypothetical protein
MRAFKHPYRLRRKPVVNTKEVRDQDLQCIDGLSKPSYDKNSQPTRSFPLRNSQQGSSRKVEDTSLNCLIRLRYGEVYLGLRLFHGTCRGAHPRPLYTGVRIVGAGPGGGSRSQGQPQTSPIHYSLARSRRARGILPILAVISFSRGSAYAGRASGIIKGGHVGSDDGSGGARRNGRAGLALDGRGEERARL